MFVVLIFSTSAQLEKKTNHLARYGQQVGLKMKAETMQILDKTTTIQLRDVDIEEMEEFTYLGSKVGKDATGKDVTSRLKKARAAFCNLKAICRSKNLRKSLKSRYTGATFFPFCCMGQSVGGYTEPVISALSSTHHV